MNGVLTCLIAGLTGVVCARVTCGAGSDDKSLYDGLIRLAEGPFEVWLPPESKPLAPRLLARMRESINYLAPLFDVPSDSTWTCLWLPKAAYPRFTSAEYGFPSNSDRGEILPAADVDLPVALTHLTPILGLESCSDNELRRWRTLLKLPKECTVKEIETHLNTSKDFYVQFCADFILPHELMHQVNNRSRLPKRCPLLHETLGQWAAIEIARHAGRKQDAELFSLYYRQLYRGGLTRVAHPELGLINKEYTNVGVQNYAWFHGAILEMLADLEHQFGRGCFEKVVLQLRKGHTGKDDLTCTEFLHAIGAALGKDLSGYFASRWGFPVSGVP